MVTMALPPIRAILVVGYNILRTMCRKYGLYLCIGATVLFIHSYSGYSNHEAKTHSSTEPQFKRSEKLLLEKELAILESQVYEKIGRNLGDSHSKGPPDPLGASVPEQHPVPVAPCLSLNKEAASALQRATTDLCKQRITNISCQVEQGTFYPERLVSYCPSNGQVRGRYLGCYMDRRNDRLLRGHVSQQKQNSPLLCTDHCYARGYVHAGLQYGKECFCGNEEVLSQHLTSDTVCDMTCPGASQYSCGGYLTMSLYQTGLAKTGVQPAVVGNSSAVAEVRIAYILTVHGRAVRHLYRLFRALYHDRHFFYIHVDVRASLMYRAALVLSERYSNVVVTETRHATIWGGSTLLTVLLQAMKHLTNSPRHWDFVINLSESDYPIKTNSALESFLAWNKGRNFLKSHGQDTNRFLRKQGLDRTFLQCEQHMWRLGERRLPSGVRVDGGSDWVCLSAPFVRYVVGQDDQLLRGLRQVYEHTLLPAESFFHTVLRNSAFCQSFTDNNLHLTNWRRKQGCRCQYKHIVDWCGCSPNDFTTQDWNKLLATRSRNLFFARKFEAVVSLSVINKLDAWLYGPYREDTPSLHSYWESRYHQLDPPSAGQDTHRTLYLAAARLAAHAVNRAVAPTVARATEDLEEGHKNTLDRPNLQKETKNEGRKRRPKRSTEKQVKGDDGRVSEEDRHGGSGRSLNTSCLVTAGAVLQAHTFHMHDQYKGVVVEAVASVQHQSVFLLESWLVPLPSTTTILKHDVLQDMQVGSDFDLKEQMFRNLEGALGPQSSLSVVLRYPPDHQHQQQEDGGAEAAKKEAGPLVLVLLDPLQMVADAVHVNVDTVDAHQLVHFTPSPPLRPGRWFVYAVSDGQLAGHTSFPVLPLAYNMAREITVMEGRSLHSGPAGGRYTTTASSSPAAPSSYLSALPEPPLGLPLTNKTATKSPQEEGLLEAVTRWADKHGHRYGASLADWINQLVLGYWSLSSTCYVSSPHVPECVRAVVQPCHRAPWSTRFPDPKTELTAADPATGYLFDPYRTTEPAHDAAVS